MDAHRPSVRYCTCSQSADYIDVSDRGPPTLRSQKTTAHDLERVFFYLSRCNSRVCEYLRVCAVDFTNNISNNNRTYTFAA